ncbi:penicillin-binding protein activator [Thiomicrorhabdus lithotrophica]|uniref:Penicillin-binding protein activator n=1 Tax=Thiomicrorhabdus lithotrophica TaxID=2949997 RepID=A0ABY8CBJ5_9GAMM|nr:penicillin-binding protein activator [Thiomicrorhabdus lithotrophica]WEJ63335.1 penicillin-binding protein activator [Thiomicrorhabdus lithotrophica]
MKYFAFLFVWLIVNLPMASFAYAEEWDDFFRDSNPRDFLGIGKQNRPLSNKHSIENNRLREVKRLDQEILILRAEMSKKNGDIKQVRQYISELNRQYIIPAFKGRVDALRKYIDSAPTSSLLSFFSFSKTIEFPLNDTNSVVAVLLPTTGDYGAVGLELQESLQNGLAEAGFQGKLIALDSALYDSAFEMWEVLKFYEPSFIFGPLKKQRIAQWQQLNTGVSTLYFNDTGSLGSGEYSLSPSKQSGLEQVFQVLNQAQYQKILVLSNDSVASQKLERTFHQAWLNSNNTADYVLQNIVENVGQTIDKGLNVQSSKDRYRWLQSVLKQPIEFAPRVRKDIEAVISFVPEQQAIQVAPYLNFLPLEKAITHIWYPSETPSISYLKANLDAWQQTFAILPLSLPSDLGKKNILQTNKLKNGLFYALGRVAIEIVKNPDLSSSVDTLVDTEYGTYVRDSNGQFNLLPIIYWADSGVFEKFNAQQ